MLPEIHDALRHLLYEYGRIAPHEVDIRFDAPVRAWIDRLTRPTISMFLCDMQENTGLRTQNFQVMRGNGFAERSQPPRRVDCQYMVSALTTDIDDEHRLLWRTLATLMTFSEMPAEFLPEEVLAAGCPVLMQVGQNEKALNVLDIWSGLGAEPRSALSLVLTLPLDLAIATRSPLVLTRTIRYTNLQDDSGVQDTRIQVAGTVRDPQGNPLPRVRLVVEGSARDSIVTDEEGKFQILHAPAGKVVLQVEQDGAAHRTVEIEVPSGSYDLVLD